MSIVDRLLAIQAEWERAEAEDDEFRFQKHSPLNNPHSVLHYDSPTESENVMLDKHDYEPGEDTHPMHTDPLCHVCGYPKNSGVHNA